MYGVVAPFIYLQSLSDGHILPLPSCHGLGCSKDNNEINFYLVLVQLFDQNIHSGEERERGKGPVIVAVIYRKGTVHRPQVSVNRATAVMWTDQSRAPRRNHNPALISFEPLGFGRRSPRIIPNLECIIPAVLWSSIEGGLLAPGWCWCCIRISPTALVCCLRPCYCRLGVCWIWERRRFMVKARIRRRSIF